MATKSGKSGKSGKSQGIYMLPKKVKNGQGILQKDAAKSGEKHEIGKMKKRSGNLHTMTSTSIWNVYHLSSYVPYILLQSKISAAAAFP